MAPPPSEPLPPSETLPQRRKILLALMMAVSLFMETLDATALAPALPTIAAQFGEVPLHLSLALSSYMVTLAVLIPASGWAADRFGARRVFASAIVLFAIGSVLCSLSGTLEQLVAARVVQGCGGAMMSPVGRLVVLQVSRKQEMVRMMAWVTIPGLIGPLIGPAVGGALTTYASWHWIFLINLPIGAVGVVMALRLIPDLPRPTPGPLDLIGLALMGTATGGLVFGIELMATQVVPVWAGALLVATAIGAFFGYLRHVRRRADPIVDFTLLRHRTFAVSFLGGLPFRLGVGAVPLLFPLLFQVGFGLDPFVSGLLVVCATAGAFLMKSLAPAIIRRVSYRDLLFWNGVANAVIYVLQAGFPALPWAVILPVLLLGGLSRSLQFTALNTIAFADIPALKMSRATSLASIGMQVGLSMGLGAGSGLVALTQALAGGGPLTAASFAPAFVVLGVFGLIHAATARALAPDAGDELRGKRR